MLIPATMPGIDSVVYVEHEAVANTVGAAIAQISGETDRIYRDMDRADILNEARRSAIEMAVTAGADKDTIQVIEVDDFPLSYLPGNAIRARVRMVGEAQST